MDDKKLEGYLKGYNTEQPIQKDISPGDPQQATLVGNLQSRWNLLNKNDIIIDFGSGEGILAKVINKVWEKGESPMYVAIDFESPLSNLSLPSNIHNHSKKINVVDFYNNLENSIIEKTKLIVIRNVFHEMNIADTSRLIFRILSFKRSIEVYIQDMHNLPKAEKGKAGWNPEIFKDYLTECGFKTNNVELQSHGGTYWFSTVAISNNFDKTIAEMGQLTLKYRKKQRHNIQETIKNINASTALISELDMVTLNNDNTALDLQISEFEEGQSGEEDKNSHFVNFKDHVKIPILLPKSQENNLTVTTEKVYQFTGMIGLIINKNIIDFPSLIKSCERNLSLWGYSNSSLFTNKNNIIALKEVIEKKDVNVKILNCNPNSEVANLRDKENLYQNITIFEILNHFISSFKEFKGNLKFDKQKQIELRLFDTIGYGSTIIIDDYILHSNYSSRNSGSSGLCFIFHNNTSSLYNQYKIIEQEFYLNWESSKSFV